MPRFWFDRMACKLPDNPTEEDIKRREFNLRIVADKKPYFMRYIYPQLESTYNKYIKNSDMKSLMEFRLTTEELMALPKEELTESQRLFVEYHNRLIPVGANDCIVNRICRKIEKEFDGLPMLKTGREDFDFSVMKSDATYTSAQYYAVVALYKEHNKKSREFLNATRSKRIPKGEEGHYKESMIRYFLQECSKICPNYKSLCNIVIDICYKNNGTKQFVWDVVGPCVLDNLLEKHDNKLSYPVMDAGGDIYFRGQRFSMRTIEGGLNNE